MLNISCTLQCLYNCIELNCLETCRILAGNVKIFEREKYLAIKYSQQSVLYSPSLGARPGQASKTIMGNQKYISVYSLYWKHTTCFKLRKEKFVWKITILELNSFIIVSFR